MAEVDQGVGVRPATTPVGGNEMAVAEEQVQPAAEVGMSPEAQAGTGAESPAGPPPEAAPPGEPNPFDETDQTGTQVGAGAAEAADLNVLLEDARAKADDHWNQLLRARAEMENLRRRHATELEKAHKYALDSFVKDLLGVRDSLELAQEAANVETADLAKLREGTDLTLKQLADVMSRFGVEPLNPLGEAFNPEYHQAMTLQPRSDMAPNRVVTVIQKGYLLNGRLVRPALVIVSSAG